MKTEIITIGDELLIGQIADTNSQWIANIANDNGFDVQRITSVADQLDDILQMLEEAGDRVSLVFITGGLGPTRDDVTRKAITRFFNVEWIHSQIVYEGIRDFLKARGIDEMKHPNAEQAKVPEKATIYPNRIGTAPGMHLEKMGVHYIFMPGVQFEMKEMMQSTIIPKLKERWMPDYYSKRIIYTQGIPEAYLARELKEWEESLPGDIKVAYLPSPGMVKIRISTKGNKIEIVDNKLDNEVEKIRHLVPDYFLTASDQNMEEFVGEILRSEGFSVATAESCTGGAIAAKLTSVPGSSHYFKGSVVAYSNTVKNQLLHVPANIISDHGAVSEEVVCAMIKGALKLFQTDYALAVSGIAGPDGGTAEKPVGTTWIAVGNKDQIITQKFLFGTKREVNIQKAAHTAMGMLYKMIQRKRDFF